MEFKLIVLCTIFLTVKGTTTPNPHKRIGPTKSVTILANGSRGSLRLKNRPNFRIIVPDPIMIQDRPRASASTYVPSSTAIPTTSATVVETFKSQGYQLPSYQTQNYQTEIYHPQKYQSPTSQSADFEPINYQKYQTPYYQTQELESGQQKHPYQGRNSESLNYQPQKYGLRSYQGLNSEAQNYHPQKYQLPDFESENYEALNYQPEKYQSVNYQPEKYQSVNYQPEKYQSVNYQPQKYQSVNYPLPNYHATNYHSKNYQMPSAYNFENPSSSINYATEPTIAQSEKLSSVKSVKSLIIPHKSQHPENVNLGSFAPVVSKSTYAIVPITQKPLLKIIKKITYSPANEVSHVTFSSSNGKILYKW